MIGMVVENIPADDIAPDRSDPTASDDPHGAAGP